MKRFISFLTVLSMTLMLFGSPDSMAAEDVGKTTEHANHKVCVGTVCTDCSHGDISDWQGIDDLSALTATGNYYLTEDIEANKQITIRSGVSITLCLNGHTIKAASNTPKIFHVGGGVLTLCDCVGTGVLTGCTPAAQSFAGDSPIYSYNGKINMYGGTLKGNSLKAGGAVNIHTAEFNMYGGKISGNTVENKGGGVYVDGSTGKFNMYGGKISGNNANRGGGVYVNNGTFIMNGGEISENVVSGEDNFGGGVYAYDGTVTMNDGKISGNTTSEKGGGVYADNTFTMNGGEISGNIVSGNFDSWGGGVYASGIFEMNNGKISDNESGFGAGGVYVLNTFTMSGGEISGNKANGFGGGAMLTGYKKEYTMSGGKISDNEADHGGGVCVNSGTFIMTSGEISGNRASGPKTRGGGIYVGATIKLSGAVTIASNIATYNSAQSPNDIFLAEDKLLTIEQGFSTAEPIGVSTKTTLTCAAPVNVTETFDGDISGSFKADVEGQSIVYDETEKRVKLAGGHKYSTDYSKDETYHWHSAICGHTDEIKDKAEHTWNSGTVTKEPTETAEGVKTYTCTVCAATKTEIIDRLEHTHTYSGDWTSDETYHWHSAICGHDVISEKAAHTEDSGTVTTPATTEDEGVKTFACSVCGYVMRTAVIPKLDKEHTHTFSTDWKHDGISHWHECACGEKSGLANHISSDWIVDTPATTDSEGVRIKKCTVCGIELDKAAIDKLPGSGSIAEEIQDTAGTKTELVQDNALIENVLTPEDKTEVENGSSFEIVLEVTDKRDSISAVDVTAASAALKSGEEIGVYVDLSLFKIKDNTERTPIYNTSGQIGITLTIPDSIYAEGRTYSVIRIHNGTVENLGGIYDRTNHRLTFYTDKFSTYAIIYTASNVITDSKDSTDLPARPSVPAVTPTIMGTAAKEADKESSNGSYIENASSATGIYKTGDADNYMHYILLMIFTAIVGISILAEKKRFSKKNVK